MASNSFEQVDQGLISIININDEKVFSQCCLEPDFPILWVNSSPSKRSTGPYKVHLEGCQVGQGQVIFLSLCLPGILGFSAPKEQNV